MMQINGTIWAQLPVTDLGHAVKVIRNAERVNEHLRECARKKSEYYLKRKHEAVK